MLLLLRSMMKDSSLYILDEATSAMDINNEVKTIRGVFENNFRKDVYYSNTSIVGH